MRKFDLSLRSSRSSYFATFRHQLTILSKTDALDEEKWLNMLGTFVKDWFRYESHFVHGRDSLVDILKERGLLSESDAVQPGNCSKYRQQLYQYHEKYQPHQKQHQDRKSGSAGMPRPISYAVFCLKKKIEPHAHMPGLVDLLQVTTSDEVGSMHHGDRIDDEHRGP